jgi:hypothetical protein
MTKQLEKLLDETVKINKAYNDFKKIDASPQLKKAAHIMLLESVDLICKELAIQQIDLDR